MNCSRKNQRQNKFLQDVSRDGTHVDTVIQIPVLCDGHDHGLVVHRRVLRAQAVEARRHPTRHGSRHLPVRERRVDTFEEHERGRVRDVRRRERGNLLDHDVRVPDDYAARVELLRRCVVVLLRVREVAGLGRIEVNK